MSKSGLMKVEQEKDGNVWKNRVSHLIAFTSHEITATITATVATTTTTIISTSMTTTIMVITHFIKPPQKLPNGNTTERMCIWLKFQTPIIKTNLMHGRWGILRPLPKRGR